MALSELLRNNGNAAEINLLRARREYAWGQPWKSIQRNKDLLRSEGLPLLTELGRAPLPTEYGDWTYIAFGDYTDGSHHELLVFGNIDNGSLGDGQNVLTRVHSACRTNEVYHAINCECRKEIQEAMRLIACEGRGNNHIFGTGRKRHRNIWKNASIRRNVWLGRNWDKNSTKA